MALDNGYSSEAPALPTPNDTRFDTPSRSISGLPNWQGSSSPYSNSSPAPIPTSDDSYFPRQTESADEGEAKRFSTQDPRRLTPNLGISFVSQIHSLKKEIDNKDTLLENLEENLHQTRARNEHLQNELEGEKSEVKSVKHQMSSLEHDMLKALEDMAKQRNDAVGNVTDTRKRLEVSKKQARAQEEDTNKVQELWDKDRETWGAQKRKLEAKVHIVEERLKTMVAEMLAVHATGTHHPEASDDVDEGMRDTWMVKGTDTFSRSASRQGAASRQSNRSMDDCIDLNTFRASRMSGLHAVGGSQMSGLSLAEELELDDEDEGEDMVHGEAGDEAASEVPSVLLPDSLPIEESEKSKRYAEDEKGVSVPANQSSGGDSSRQHSMSIIEDYINLPGKRFSILYTDTGTQFTPPTSPIIPPQRKESVTEKQTDQTERAANQSRKRVAIPHIFAEQNGHAKAVASKPPQMISCACQTVEQPEERASLAGPASKSNDSILGLKAGGETTRSASTQTSGDALPVSRSAGSRLSPPPFEVPVIAIHPPGSRPVSSHNSVVLPPRTRNAACQVAIDMPNNSRSIAMQTEEIRVDKRAARVPPKLQPTVYSPPTPARLAEKRAPNPLTTNDTPIESSRNHVRHPTHTFQVPMRRGPSSPKFRDVYPGINDDGPVDSKQHFGPRRPIRSESIFAGFEDPVQVDDEKMHSDLSDDDFANAEPIKKTLSKVQNSWKLVLQSQELSGEKQTFPTESTSEQISKAIHEAVKPRIKGPPNLTSKTFQSKSTEIPREPFKSTREADIRRKALISNGISEHTSRIRSPSAPDPPGKRMMPIAPPFPVPTRASSRKIPLSASDGAGSPTPQTTSFFTARQGQQSRRPPSKTKILRKTQSAAAVTKEPTRQPPPPPSTAMSSTVPASPSSTLIPRNQFVLPYDSVAELPKQLAKGSRPQSRAGSASIESPSQQTSVVDAIAQTMVGEWMWKYVRKRTSFGVTETPQAEFEMVRNGETGSSSGVRHKRWVWLAPYESAVIWSSKQPTSGPALLGKGGRKLTIQSVLDVKDDTPLPKNAGSQTAFDRSILILTPERALKFTAVSKERHYIWLTALSFLSHSTQGMDDLAHPPPIPEQEFRAPSSQASSSGFRRTAVRDSLTSTKAKSRPSVGGHSYSNPSGELEREALQENRMGWAEAAANISDDAAEPPQVPRRAAHSRKRSSTGPRPVPLSAFHSYPINSMPITASHSMHSVQNPTSREKYDRYMPSGPHTTQNTMNRRTVDSLTAPVVPDNFFDPIGTMRMEAFIDKGDIHSAGASKEKKQVRSYRTRKGRKKDLNSYWGVDELVVSTSSRPKSDDPFTGF